MREIALATQIGNKDIIKYVEDHIRSNDGIKNIIMTTYVDKDFCYIMLACEDQSRIKFDKLIKDAISSYIVEVYKLDYLKHRAKMNSVDNLLFNTYMKALSLFDKNTDMSVLDKIIVFNDTFHIDSFVKFRLEPLRRHWDNMLILSRDGELSYNSSTFLEVIRFLIDTMDNPIYKVKIICSENAYHIYIMREKNDEVVKVAECKSGLDLVSNLLSNCPNHIDVYTRNDGDDDNIKFLSDIFVGKLKVYVESKI